MLVAPPLSGASLPSEQARADQLAQQIVAEGAAVQRAVVQQDAAQARLSSLDAQLAATGAQLLRDRRADIQAARTLRRLVVEAYMTGIGSASLPALFDAGNDTAVLAREYSGVAAGRLQQAISAFRAAEQRTEITVAALRSERAQASTALARLTAARQSAQASLAQDVVLLEQAKGDIAALQAAAAEQARQASAQEAALAQEEAARAARPKPGLQVPQPSPQPTPQPSVLPVAQPTPHPTTQPTPQPTTQQGAQTQSQTTPTTGAQPASGGYVNPLRAIAALSPERIDQGVDYSGYGPIYPIGDGVVLSTVNTGWPGGTFIAYRLTDGPAAGLVVYAAEDIQPSVQVGQQVSPTTMLGTVYEGPDGIETGWADSTGNGATMAYVAGQFTGANATAYGANFSQLLAALGAPPGVPNGTPAGSLPANWPTW